MGKKEKFWSLEKNNAIENVVDKLFKLVSMVAIFATVIIMVITVADVIMRAAVNKSVPGVMEITQFLMVFVCYFAMPWVTWQFGHIKVDLLTTKLPEKAQGVILVIDKFLCIAFTLFMRYGNRAGRRSLCAPSALLPVSPCIRFIISHLS